MRISSAVLALVLLLAACGQRDHTAAPEHDPKEAAPLLTYRLMTHYSTPEERRPVDGAIAEVKELYPYVKIIPEAMANDNGEQLKTRIAIGDIPDIVDVNSQTILNMVQSGSALRLDEYFAQHPEYADLLLPSVKKSQLRYTDGHIYAFPRTGPAVHLLFYNKKVFREHGIALPNNYPKLLQTVKDFNARGVVPIAMFGSQAWPIGAFFDIFAMRENPEGTMALSNGTAKASDPGFAKAIGKMGELIRAGVFQKGAVSTDYYTAEEMFYSGKAAMLLNGEWEIGASVKRLGDDVDFFDVFPTTDSGHEGDNANAMPGGGEFGGYAVSSHVQNPGLAVNVAAAFSLAFQKVSFRIDGSTMVTIRTEGIVRNEPLPAMARKLLARKDGFVMNSLPEHSLPNQRFAASFGEELQKFVSGESVEDFIRHTDRMIETTR